MIFLSIELYYTYKDEAVLAKYKCEYFDPKSQHYLLKSLLAD